MTDRQASQSPSAIRLAAAVVCVLCIAYGPVGTNGRPGLSDAALDRIRRALPRCRAGGDLSSFVRFVVPSRKLRPGTRARKGAGTDSPLEESGFEITVPSDRSVSNQGRQPLCNARRFGAGTGTESLQGQVRSGAGWAQAGVA